MSIIKINTNVRFTARKVTTLKNVSGVGTVQKYFTLSGTSRDVIPCQCKPRDTTQLKCLMASTATGFFFGNMESGCQYAIRATNTNIEWYNGSSTAVASKAKSEIDFSEPHVYGFLEGKPIFDNALVSTTFTPPTDGSVTSNNGYGIGQAIGSTSKIIEISIQRLDIIAFAGDGRDARRITHYYPVKTLSNALRWYDLYSRIPQSEYSNSYLIQYYDSVASASIPLAEGEQYGIQLDDIRYITQSGYKDLLALLAEDNPSKALPGATPPYRIDGKPFAFRINTIPSGMSHSSGDDWNGLADGELVKGRRPKWNIWHDIIKFGKYTDDQTASNVMRKMHFNIFKDNRGEDTHDMLAVFDGYTESSGDVHEPSFSIDGEIGMEFHNGFCANIAYEDKIVGSLTSNGGGYDEHSIFRFRRVSGGMGNVILGNLPLWNYSASEQDDAKLDLSRAIGGGLVLKWYDGANWSRLASFIEFISQTDGQGSIVPFSTESNAETQSKFRTDGFNGNFMLYDARIDQLRRHFGQRNPINVKATIVLARDTTTEIDSDLIDCSALVPLNESTISGTFDNRISTNTPTNSETKVGDRVIYGSAVDDVKVGGASYEVWSQSQRTNEGYRTMYNLMLEHQSTKIGLCVALPIVLLNKENNQPMNLFDGATPNIAVYAMITARDASGKISGRYFGFASMLNAILDPYYYNIQGQGYSSTYRADRVYLPNGSMVTLSAGQSADAIFMWTDLYKDFSSQTLTRDNNPMTAYVRTYLLESAPHAWNLYKNNTGFDTDMESDYINLSTPKLKFVCHNYDRLIPMGTKLAIGYEVFADMWLSLWDTNTNQRVMSQWSKLNGRTIKLYEILNENMHNPEGGRSSHIEEIATFTIPNGTFTDAVSTDVQDRNIFSADNDCRCNIIANDTYPGYAIIGTAGATDVTNMVHIRITSNGESGIKPLAGAQYYIDIE